MMNNVMRIPVVRRSIIFIRIHSGVVPLDAVSNTNLQSTMAIWAAWTFGQSKSLIELRFVLYRATGQYKRQKDRKAERQKDRKTEIQKDRKTERQKDRKTER